MVTLLAFCVVAILVWAVLLSRLAGRTSAAQSRLSGPAAIELTENGFHFLTPLWKCEVEWSAVRSFSQTRSSFLLIDDTPSTFIVPMRAFMTDELRDEFCRFVRDRVVAGRSARP